MRVTNRRDVSYYGLLEEASHVWCQPRKKVHSIFLECIYIYHVVHTNNMQSVNGRGQAIHYLRIWPRTNLINKKRQHILEWYVQLKSSCLSLTIRSSLLPSFQPSLQPCMTLTGHLMIIKRPPIFSFPLETAQLSSARHFREIELICVF